MKIAIKIEGLAKLKSAFQEVILATSDFTPSWKAVQKEFFEIEKAQFQSEGASGKSGKWKALSPAYAAVKQRRYGSLPILQREDGLYESLSRQTGDSVYEPKKGELVLGTLDKKATKHQRGGRKLPKREPISITSQQAEKLVEPIKKGLEKKVRKLKL